MANEAARVCIDLGDVDRAAEVHVDDLHGPRRLQAGGALGDVAALTRLPGVGKKLAERLVANSFADTVFFTNSGAEAVECAIKTARRYHHHHGRPDKHELIAFSSAFHGSSTGGEGTGASRLTGDIAKILSELPAVVESLSGVDMRKLIEQIPAVHGIREAEDLSEAMSAMLDQAIRSYPEDEQPPASVTVTRAV